MTQEEVVADLRARGGTGSDQERVFAWAAAVLSETPSQDLAVFRNRLLARASACETLSPARSQAMREVAEIVRGLLPVEGP